MISRRGPRCWSTRRVSSISPPRNSRSSSDGSGTSEGAAMVVELTRVSRAYGNVRAVNDVSLKLEPGECFGLVGRNGAGKSTTLRMIAGMLGADVGTVRIFGRDPLREPEQAKLGLGYLAEDQSYPSVLHPKDLFKFFAASYPTWDWDFAESLVERFQIPVDRPLKQLSKGQQRQAALVCAVA